jgi:hypothetical protein
MITQTAHKYGGRMKQLIRRVLTILLVLITACSELPSITSVTITPAVTTVAATGKVALTLAIKGNGTFDARADWSVTPNLGSIVAQGRSA